MVNKMGVWSLHFRPSSAKLWLKVRAGASQIRSANPKTTYGLLHLLSNPIRPSGLLHFFGPGSNPTFFG